jgi:hypothetical protein
MDLNANPRQPALDQYNSLLLAWILVQGLAVAPAIVLSTSCEWRRVPLPLRFQTVFDSLFASWVALCAFGLRVPRIIDTPLGTRYPAFTAGRRIGG